MSKHQVANEKIQVSEIIQENFTMKTSFSNTKLKIKSYIYIIHENLIISMTIETL